MPPEPFSDEELISLWEGGESDRVEFKEALSRNNSKKIAETICAFANDLASHGQAGVLFIGIQNDRNCAGLGIDEELLRELTEFSNDSRIQPFPFITVQPKKLKGCDLAILCVRPALSPPVRFKGRCMVRIDSTTRAATPDQERVLSEKRRFQHPSYDLRPIPGAKPTDLDETRFREEYLPRAVSPEIIEENQRGVLEQMRSLRLLTPDDMPTLTGLLFLGQDPRYWIPDAYLQFLRRDGTELTSPIQQQKVIDGVLQDQAHRLEELLETQIRSAMTLGGERHLESPDYPLSALRELTRNAMIHRSYEGANAPVRIHWFTDRVEILNPGGPFGMVNEKTIGNPGVTAYRNPTIAEAMKNLGFVERFGYGLQKACQALKENGNPPLKFYMEGGYTQVTVRARQS